MTIQTSVTVEILQCQCGAKVRVPSDGHSVALRCPKCKRSIGRPADAAAPLAEPVPPLPAAETAPPSANTLDSISSRPLAAGESVVCPICQTNVRPGEEVVTCESCDQVHHRDCWHEIGGCATYGCAKAPVVDKSDAAAAEPLSAWGDTKKCPACGETIKSIAMRCRYCHTDFDSVDPLSVADLRQQALTEAANEVTKKVVVGVFVASIIGILAPLMLIVSLVYMLGKRQQLAKCGPLFVIMGWASLGLSAFYSLCMLALFFTGA